MKNHRLYFVKNNQYLVSLEQLFLKVMVSGVSMMMVLLAWSSQTKAQIQGIKRGDRVKVAAPVMQDKSIKGTVAENTDSVLVVGTEQYVKTIPHAFITDLSISNGQRRSLGRGLLIGLGTGALGGGLVGAMTYTECTEEGFLACAFRPTSSGEAFAMGAVSGGVVGLVSGGIIGALVKRDRWQRVPVTVSTGQPLPVPGTEIDFYPSLSMKIRLNR